MTTVIVSSVIATKYRNGGNACAVLNWIQGLRKLGITTYYVEQIAPESCTDDHGARVPFELSANVAYFKDVMCRAGLERHSALVCGDGATTCGISYLELLDTAADTDLLLNITGHLTLDAVMRRLRRKAYLDLDPGYTQFWHASGNPGARLSGHDFFFTIGENIGTPQCRIPTGGIRWRPTRQPIVLPPLSANRQPWSGRFTTVASWRGAYGPASYKSSTFGLKAHEFRKFVELPQRFDTSSFEIALDIHVGDQRDLDSLRDHGWRVVDPRRTVPDPRAFDEYIHGSDAEWSVAQGVYVDTCSGWFSDRTVRYLAAGKPAVVQDTGFTRTLRVGEGLIPFRTMEEAVAGVRAIERDPAAHSEASREIATTYFDSDRVLGRLLDDVGVAA